MSQKIYFLLILFAIFQLINSRIISTNDLKDALSQAEPGDVIELKSGTYRDVPYTLKNGTWGYPIKIKSAANAEVIFEGDPNKSMFEAYYVHDVVIEGPMKLYTALHGFKILNSTNINITGLYMADMKRQAILMSGHNNKIIKNRIDGCVWENQGKAKTMTSGWGQCVAIWGVRNGIFSTNTIVEENIIQFSFGEGLYFLNCDNCRAYKNNITNALSNNIYIDSSKNIDIDGNILKVNDTYYNNKYGKAGGIGMSPDYPISEIQNINITNNIIIGTRIGISFFTMGAGGGYNNVKIFHNTLWNVDVTPIWFKKPTTGAYRCEMKNNFIYYDGAIEFEPKSAWEISNNYFYNISSVPNIYSGPNSKAAKSLDLKTVFNQEKICTNYYDPDVKIDCLRPSKEPGILNLYQSGISLKYSVPFDIYHCTRSKYNPSIGAFEFPEACSEDIEPPDTDTPEEEYEVRFNITYCTSGSRVIKMVASTCGWNVANCPEMTQYMNCIWVLGLRNALKENFTYKFVVANGNSAYLWESDPFRQFNGQNLITLAKKSPNGKYEDCIYSKIGNVIYLQCFWR